MSARRLTRGVQWTRSTHTDTRVRFAPSPTGELHLGGLRTALYNYLFARKTRGKFIVRIEDTDRARLVQGSAQRIHDLLSHYGLSSDEDPWQGGPTGPYVQSERLPLYREHAERLVDQGHAYRCFCTAKRLEMLRKEAARSGTIPQYDKRCRSLSAEEAKKRADAGEEHVIRFVLDFQEVFFQDLVFGDVRQRLEESDPILLKSDGFPTYHMANIVDDKLMKISHVIRGMEWLSSTGKHVTLYKAFGWKPPHFVHLPLITRDGQKKLSKRDKDAYVDYYDKEKGVLPKAVLNFLIRNGSGIRDFDSTKLYELEEMVDKFDVGLIGRRNFMLDAESLAQYGSAAFRAATDCGGCEKELLTLIRGHLRADIPDVAESVTDEYLERVIAFLREKEETFAFLGELTHGKYAFFFTRPQSAEKLLSLFRSEVALDALERVIAKGSCDLEKAKECATAMGMKYPQLLTILRVSLIDGVSGPPIGELRAFFGDEECIERLKQMVEYIKKGP